MSLKGACDKLESAFAVAESKLDRVNEKVDQSIAQANNSGQAAGKLFKYYVFSTLAMITIKYFRWKTIPSSSKFERHQGGTFQHCQRIERFEGDPRSICL